MPNFDLGFPLPRTISEEHREKLRNNAARAREVKARLHAIGVLRAEILPYLQTTLALATGGSAIERRLSHLRVLFECGHPLPSPD